MSRATSRGQRACAQPARRSVAQRSASVARSGAPTSRNTSRPETVLLASIVRPAHDSCATSALHADGDGRPLSAGACATVARCLALEEGQRCAASAQVARLTTCVTLNGSGIQLAVGPQPLWLRNHNSGPAQRIMVKRLATSPHDPLGITDSACKNQSVVVSVQYGPFNPYTSIRSTTIGKSRVAIDPIAMHTSWRSNSDIASATR
ncbi:hypothetical protein F511_33244 [Dorcoceras hygrometricum]|uniref:Uncharacterized protein n=1 Tax=Dorcoceras hygrometricum TaxID=472368 RepID=A0A2Z7D027_9LAMI|nr:hypothetical protein F511_33244 [Dorcoceras hygrometricum]